MSKLVALFLMLSVWSPIVYSQKTSSYFQPKFTWMTLDQAATMAPLEVKHLKLSRKNLTGFPENISRFENLESLSLQGLKLTSVPEIIFNFKKLSHLDLSKNQIQTLPDSLCQLSQIEVLILSRNPLVYLPFCIGNHMNKLKALDLYDTDVVDLPDTMEKINTLKYIDFQGIQFRQEEIDALKKRFPIVKFIFDPPCNCFK